jgi:integrase
MITHNRQEKIAILPKLHSYGGDTSKQWFVFYSYRNPASGKMQRFRVYEGFTERATAEAKLDYGLGLVEQLTLKIRNGWSPFDERATVVYRDSLTYAEVARKYGNLRKTNKLFPYYCHRWLQSKQVSIRPPTFTTYKSKLRYFCDFLVKQKIDGNDITEFSADYAQAFNRYLRYTRRIGPKSINEYNVLMRSFFDWLIQQKLLAKNPFRGIKKLKADTVKPRIYNREMLARISEEAKLSDPQMLMVIRILFNCFIRPKEIRNIKLGHIDFHSGMITVPANIAKDHEERHVDVPFYILDEMKRLGFHKLPQHFYLVTSQKKPGARPVSKNYLYLRFRKIRQRLEISTDYKFYALKHTGMVELKLSGADWFDIRNQAGHASLDQTIEYTTELMKEGSRHIRERAPQI